MTTYFGILTKVGEAKEANAKALGVPVKIAELEVGDGGGILPVPNREQTSLIGSKHRAPINRIFVDPNNAAWLVVEQVIPEQFGGWWARELGLRDADGDLVAVANCPPTYKPQMAEGSARTQVVRMVLQVSSVNNFTLKIDPSVVLATRAYVDEEAAKKLGKGDTAASATKLATAHKFSVSGAGQALPRSFDGLQDVELVLTDLDMDKATKGVLAVEQGGTGAKNVAKDAFLLGNDTGPLQQLTPEQVRIKIGAPKSSDVLPVATVEEARALTSDKTLMTPKKLEDVFKDGQVLAGVNINQKIPGGMITKTGVYYQGSASSQNFATPFPNVCAAVVGAESAVPLGQAGYVVVQFGGVSREGFNAQLRTMDGLFPNAATVRYIAIGY